MTPRNLNRPCIECGATIPESRGLSRTCSWECHHGRRTATIARHSKKLTLEKSAQAAAKRAVERPCHFCGELYLPRKRTDQKYCSRRCQMTARGVRKLRDRPPMRPCQKCGADVAWKAGAPVCDFCLSDPRDPSKARATERRRTLRSYGITQEQFDKMVADQGGRCAICGTCEPSNGHKKQMSWSIDHNRRCCPGHGSCGKCVRALLCTSCNMGIGQLGDDPDRLNAAARYLRSHSAARMELAI